MAYASLTRITADIPAADIARLLDDNGDGAADAAVSEAVLAEVDLEIHGLITPRLPVPLVEPIPQKISDAADDLLIAKLWQRRRLLGAKSQAAKDAAAARVFLAALGTGEASLGPTGPTPVIPSGLAITEPSRTHSRCGVLPI